MGKKLDALFGRSFKASRLKALVNLAVSRLAVLKNQRQTRCSLARSDVVQLLNLGHHDRALLRIEHVIKEQNLLDLFVMIEGYCHLLAERINLIEQEKVVCPEELKEAVSGLFFASTRCGEFPELQEIRAVFTSRYGKEFAARAIELRNNCGVNPKMIQKLSTRQPSLEDRLKVLKEIASENNIVLQIKDVSPEEEAAAAEEKSVRGEQKQKQKQKQNQPKPSAMSGGSKHDGDDAYYCYHLPDEIESLEGLSSDDSVRTTRKYKDVGDAAEAAFKSAAYAAAAARAAVELSRSESRDPDDDGDDDDDQKSPGPGPGPGPGQRQTHEENNLRRIEDDKVHPILNYPSESQGETRGKKKVGESERRRINATEIKGSVPAKNSVSSSECMLKGTRMSSDDITFDESEDDDETMKGQLGGVLQLSRSHESGSGTLHMNEDLDSEKSCTFEVDDLSEKENVMVSRSPKKFPLRPPQAAVLKAEPGNANSKQQSAGGSRIQDLRPLNANAENKPMSVRTRRTQGR